MNTLRCVKVIFSTSLKSLLMTDFNISTVPEVPKKPVPEEKVAVPVPKKVEPPVKGMLP